MAAPLQKADVEEEVQAEILAMPGNAQCFDCGQAMPRKDVWVSLAHGAVICINCAGVQRGLGTHITRVKSLQKDQFSEREVELLRLGGNASFREFLQENGGEEQWVAHHQKERYSTPVAVAHRRNLAAAVGGSDDSPARRVISPFSTAALERPRPSCPGTSLARAPQWTRDEDAPKCELCKKDFTRFCFRRHHCRACGKVVCAECSPKECWRLLEHVSFGKDRLQRICKVGQPPAARLIPGLQL